MPSDAIGIDFDSFGIYMCRIVDGEAPRTYSGRLRTDKGDVYQAIQAAPTILVMGIASLATDHVDTWIERATGMSRKADWTLGAIFGAIMATWPRVFPTEAIRVMPAADWKRAIGVAGNCKKDIANARATLLWRDAYPDVAPPTDHNMLDAYAIAYAGSHR